ncbi:TonB-dependent receptor plug domain-containing protein [Undibacterium sp. Xuan67W]
MPSCLPSCLSSSTSSLLTFSRLALCALTSSSVLSATAADENGAANTNKEPLHSVEVRGAHSVLDERKQATASKAIVNQEDIARYGDNNLSDVLKRVPGLGFSSTGALQMRGLGNGYTQILLNGEATPQGFLVDSIAPDLIERIEVLRSATAEFSTQAIAGTINIILKSNVKKPQHDLKIGVTSSNGKISPTMSLQLADRRGALAYTVAGTLQHQQRITPSTQDETGSGQIASMNLQRHANLEERFTKDELSVAPRLVWTFSEDDTLTSQSFLSSSRINNVKERHEISTTGTLSEFPNNTGSWDAYTNALRSNLNWRRKLSDSARIETSVGLNISHRHTYFDFKGMSAQQALLERHEVVSGIDDQTATFSGKYTAPYIDHHALVLGWDGSLIRRDENRIEHMSDAQGQGTADSNEAYQSNVRRLALFVQDEWEISRQLSAALGLRWEGLQTTTTGNVLSQVHNQSSVFSPLLQSVWKLSDDAANARQTQQFRLALTRTYKAPTTTSLIPRRYTVDNNNSAINPDNQGNPQLRPELAWGLDAAFEQYFGQGGLFSVSMFVRKIDDVILDKVTQQNTVWTSTPTNSGKAQVHGIELEIKLPLQNLMSKAPAIDLRANLNRNWSSVDQIPGPDNRLDQQTPLSANLALDYKWDHQLTLGGNLSYQRGGNVRNSSTLSGMTGNNRTLDLYAAWSLAKQTQLRLSLTNLFPKNKLEIAHYKDIQTARQSTTTTSGLSSVKLMLEQAF